MLCRYVSVSASSSAGDLGHEARQQVADTLGLGDEAGQFLSPISPLGWLGPLNERLFRLRHLIGGGTNNKVTW